MVAKKSYKKRRKTYKKNKYLNKKGGFITNIAMGVGALGVLVAGILGYNAINKKKKPKNEPELTELQSEYAPEVQRNIDKRNQESVKRDEENKGVYDEVVTDTGAWAGGRKKKRKTMKKKR